MRGIKEEDTEFWQLLQQQQQQATDDDDDVETGTVVGVGRRFGYPLSPIRLQMVGITTHNDDIIATTTTTTVDQL